MRRAVVPVFVALSLTVTPYRPADAWTPTPLQALLIVGTISGGLWAGILYFYHKIGADKCMFQPSTNSYYDLGGYLDGGGLSTRTEYCGAAEIDATMTMNSLDRNELLVVQPNPNLGWNFKATTPHSSCTNSFNHQLSVAINAYFTCLDSSNFQASHPIYVLGNHGSSPPSGATVYNWATSGNLGGGKYGWAR